MISLMKPNILLTNVKNEYIAETLVTHKSLKFKEIIKRTNLIAE